MAFKQWNQIIEFMKSENRRPDNIFNDQKENIPYANVLQNYILGYLNACAAPAFLRPGG